MLSVERCNDHVKRRVMHYYYIKKQQGIADRKDQTFWSQRQVLIDSKKIKMCDFVEF